MNRPAATELPPGVRDLLPEEAQFFQATAITILDEFSLWGYERVMTPAYEYEGVLDRASYERQNGLRWVDPNSGQILAFRSDFTAQIARMAATRSDDSSAPLRLCYEGGVVRREPAGRVHERFQTGVELIGVKAPHGEVELLVLVARLLGRLGIKDVVLDLSHAGFVRALFEQLGWSEEAELQLREQLAKKNSSAIRTLLAQKKVSATLKRLLIKLPMWFGDPGVVDEALEAVSDNQKLRRPLLEFRRLLQELRRVNIGLQVQVDLGEVRGFGYYSGLRFAVYASGASEALISGGRYDGLIGRFGRSLPAIGLAVHVDRLYPISASRLSALPAKVLLVGEAAEVNWVAEKLRHHNLRVCLGLEFVETPRREAWARLRRGGYRQVIWLDKRDVFWQGTRPAEQRGRSSRKAFFAALENVPTAAEWLLRMGLIGKRN